MISMQQVKLALVARFLANYLEKNIPAGISNKELSTSLNIPEDQIAARLMELRSAKFAIQVRKGLHQVNPLKIEKFIEEIERETVEKSE